MGWWWTLTSVCVGGKGGGHFFEAGHLIELGAFSRLGACSKKYGIIIFN